MKDFAEYGNRSVSDEVAKLAKEKCFNIPCNKALSLKDNKVHSYVEYHHFNDDESVKEHFYFPLCSVPTQQALQYWLRENFDICCESLRTLHEGKIYAATVIINSKQRWSGGLFDTYEDALEASLLEGLNFIQKIFQGK